MGFACNCLSSADRVGGQRKRHVGDHRPNCVYKLRRAGPLPSSTSWHGVDGGSQIGWVSSDQRYAAFPESIGKLSLVVIHCLRIALEPGENDRCMASLNCAEDAPDPSVGDNDVRQLDPLDYCLKAHVRDSAHAGWRVRWTMLDRKVVDRKRSESLHHALEAEVAGPTGREDHTKLPA